MSEKTQRMKIWAGVIGLIITNIGTLATAIIANQKADKADDETTAKAAYQELSEAISNISKENVSLNNDVANLRGYIAGLASRGAFSRREQNSSPAPSRRPSRTEEPRPSEAPPVMKSKVVQYSPPSIGQLKK